MTIRNHPIEAEELMAYLDGELGPEQATAAAAHLETCMECQQLAADLRGVSHTLKSWELPPTNSTVPKSLAAAVEEHLPEPQATLAIALPWYRHSWFRSWAPALAGGALVATVIVASMPVYNLNKKRAPSLVDYADVDESSAPSAAPVSPPSAGPVAAKSAPGYRARLEGNIGGSVGTGDRDRLQQSATAGNPSAPNALNLLPTGPMIIRTAELSLTTREFDKGRAQVEDILKSHRGYVATLNVTGAADTGRSLTASLRIPSTQLDLALTELKSLGRLVSESKNGQEVTAQYVDLQARLNNSRNTEHRLIDLLQNRTGKLSDVLEVENELARVRGEIESMEAERKNLSNQVDFATINLTLTEDYRAQLQVVPPSTSTRLINAAVEGYRSMVDGLMSIALFFLSSGPTLLFWAAILFFPARFAWKRLRRNLSGASL